MAAIKQSICYPMFKPHDMPLEQLLKEMKRIGYPAIEIWGRNADFEEVCALAQKFGMVIASMGGHHSLADGLNKWTNHPRILEELKESIAVAKEKKIPGLICLSGNVNEGQSDEDAKAACAEILRKAAPIAEAAGVNLNLELLNTIVDHPGYQCCHTTWGVDVVKRVNSPRVKLLYDIYHMQIMEGHLISTISENIQYIGHFHTAGNPGRNDMDDTQEINYRGVCAAIAKTSYDLYIGHEFRPLKDPIAALEETYKTCQAG